MMRWQVRDFKGVDSAEIDLQEGKATILTGVNSSGKSSIIQSLLLAAQSIHSGGPVVLNGPLVRLGEADDLVRDESRSGSVSIALDLLSVTLDEVIDGPELRARYELVPAQDNATLQPRLVEISAPEGGLAPFVMANANARANDVQLALEVSAQLGPRHALHIKSLLGSNDRQLRTYVVMQGLRPAAVVQLMDPADIGKRYRKALEVFLTNAAERQSGVTPSTNSRVGRAVLIREFVRLFSQSARRQRDRAVRRIAEHFRDARLGNPYSFQGKWDGLDEEKQRMLIDLAVEERQRHAYISLPLRGGSWGYSSAAGGLLESALESILGDTFSALGVLGETLENVASRVQYLGPLRDEPRVVWNHWNELARSLPVGTRGEYSAAVLSRANLTRVRYVNPEGELGASTLGNAVDEWLAYLEIGDRVSARSHGKLGVGLDLNVAGHVRDLTSVGVGVSQALPLLVGLLIAPQDALFIVEQPELHLHPAVQARLADFMLTARPDLALIVETHSDSFVTRVRRRVAEGLVPGGRIDITFVEPEANGSRARSLEISEFGDLSEWPDGFLSSAEEDVRAILRANIVRAKGGSVNAD